MGAKRDLDTAVGRKHKVIIFDRFIGTKEAKWITHEAWTMHES